MKSVRIAGPSNTRPHSGACGSTGWPSKATTSGRCSLNSSPKIRADAALMRRRRMRSPALTAKRSGARPLIVTVLPSRPDMLISMRLPKPPAMEASSSKRKSPRTQTTSRSTGSGCGSPMINAPIRPPPDLLGAMRMGVVPEGAGIRHGELVDEAVLRLDRRLGHIGRAVHRVRNAQAMPVDRGVLRQPVLDSDLQPFALAQSDLWPGNAAAIAPDAGLRIGLGRDPHPALGSDQHFLRG